MTEKAADRPAYGVSRSRRAALNSRHYRGAAESSQCAISQPNLDLISPGPNRSFFLPADHRLLPAECALLLARRNGRTHTHAHLSIGSQQSSTFKDTGDIIPNSGLCGTLQAHFLLFFLQFFFVAVNCVLEWLTPL